jgi:hypothetical protein
VYLDQKRQYKWEKKNTPTYSEVSLGWGLRSGWCTQGAQKYLVNHAIDTYCKNGIATLFKEWGHNQKKRNEQVSFLMQLLNTYLPVLDGFVICRQDKDCIVGCLAPLDLVYLLLYFQTF